MTHQELAAGTQPDDTPISIIADSGQWTLVLDIAGYEATLPFDEVFIGDYSATFVRHEPRRHGTVSRDALTIERDAIPTEIETWLQTHATEQALRTGDDKVVA
mgnify:CR=1 FL=1